MTAPQLVLIGGATAAGKTTTARALSRKLGAGWLQADTIWLAIRAILPVGSPQRTLLSLDEAQRSWVTAEALAEQHVAASRFLAPALRITIEREMAEHPILVVDGAWIIPEFVASFDLPGAYVRGVFIHEPVAEEVKRAMVRRSGLPATADWQRHGATAWSLHGDWLAAEARRHGIPVVEARPRETLLQRVEEALAWPR